MADSHNRNAVTEGDHFPLLVEVRVSTARRVGDALHLLNSRTEVVECRTKDEALQIYNDLQGDIFPEVKELQDQQKAA